MTADFIEATVLPGHGQREWVVQKAAAMRAKGVTWMRLSHPLDKPDHVFIEGWLVQPAEQGPHPWEAKS